MRRHGARSKDPIDFIVDFHLEQALHDSTRQDDANDLALFANPTDASVASTLSVFFRFAVSAPITALYGVEP